MRPGGGFELFLFALDLELVSPAVAAGVDAVVVDWETRGKNARQDGFDTLVADQTVDDLRRVRALTSGHVVCRVNAPGPWSADEISLAAEAGADEVLVPMVRRVDEVEALLALADGSCALGVLVETPEAVGIAEPLGALPLSRVYLGLNDLAIARGSASIFEPFVDGVAEYVRRSFRCPFGVGGLTVASRGAPIPARLIAAELARLGCDFTFLRRSFHRDVDRAALHREVPAIRAAVEEARARTDADVAADSAAFRHEIEVTSRSAVGLAGA